MNSVLVLTLFAGCKGGPLGVDVPPGYRGRVLIMCTGADNDRIEHIAVDSTGYSQASCPTRPEGLVIQRDGSRISADGPIKWDITDGTVFGFHLIVR